MMFMMMLQVVYYSNTKQSNKKKHQHDFHNLENQEITTANFKCKITTPLKYLGNFRRLLDLPLITCEEEVHLLWKKLNYMIGPTFKKISKLFVFSFEASNVDTSKDSFDKCYMQTVEIEDFVIY